jgi:hypothetical protein
MRHEWKTGIEAFGTVVALAVMPITPIALHSRAQKKLAQLTWHVK